MLLLERKFLSMFRRLLLRLIVGVSHININPVVEQSGGISILTLSIVVSVGSLLITLLLGEFGIIGVLNCAGLHRAAVTRVRVGIGSLLGSTCATIPLVSVTRT